MKILKDLISYLKLNLNKELATTKVALELANEQIEKLKEENKKLKESAAKKELDLESATNYIEELKGKLEDIDSLLNRATDKVDEAKSNVASVEESLEINK